MLDANVAARVREALFAQKYNLLLGAGVSLDSTDRANKPLKGAEDLRLRLCELTGSRTSSPLWRVAGLLTPEQVETHLTKPYQGCNAGITARMLTQFAWRAAYTLNIDDVVENAYETTQKRLQSIVPVNYTREYESFRNPHELPLIHLHGSVRYPDQKYVFSLQEYASLQRNLNPWVHTLSGLIVSEPFIIAGTSLFEPDLEFFIAHRPSNSEVLARAPSLLIEPYPDAGTKKDCERLQLVLVEATMEAFLNWLTHEFGPPPTPLKLREPIVRPRTLTQVSVHASSAFWSDFEFVLPPDPGSPATSTAPTGFMFGRPPCWKDIDSRMDVPLQDQLQLMDEIRRWQASNDANQFICLSGRAGSGKSTTIRRVASELAAHGLQVFYLKATAGIDVDSAVKFISTVADPILIAIDSLAEHGDQLIDLLEELGAAKRICVVGAERQYRMRLVREFLEDKSSKYFEVDRWRVEERIDLIRRYAAMGLVGNAAAIADPRKFAAELAENTVAESVCRILNDFRPLRAIVRSLWNDTDANGRPAYLATALAFYCHPVGIRRDVILSMCPSDLLSDLSVKDAPLRITTHPDDDDYLIPANSTLAALLVEEMSTVKPQRLLEIAVDLANALAPFVTRHTIKQRTVEARLAGRLFDADGVLPDLLKAQFGEFYERTHERWKWNSRYWEQRALFVGERDRALAIQHARHAVAIERHPFPMTTLAHVLFSAVADVKPLRQDYFNEALSLMEETLRIEARWERGRTRKAYWAVIDGVTIYMKAGGRPTTRQAQFVRQIAGDVLRLFDEGTDLHMRASALVKDIAECGDPSM